MSKPSITNPNSCHVTGREPEWKPHRWIDRMILRCRPYLAREIYCAWAREQEERDKAAARFACLESGYEIEKQAYLMAICAGQSLEGDAADTHRGRCLMAQISHAIEAVNRFTAIQAATNKESADV